MTKLLRQWPTTVSLLLLVAAGVIAGSDVTVPQGAPSMPSREVVPRRIGEIPPSVVGSELRDEPVAVDAARSTERNTASATREERAIKSTADRYAGQLQYCYEKQLKVNPTIEGRIEVGWTVSGGAVTGTPYIVANTTGDAALADCVSSKIRRWQFPPDVDGDMSSQFIFQQKE